MVKSHGQSIFKRSRDFKFLRTNVTFNFNQPNFMKTQKILLLLSVFFFLNACKKSSPEDFDSDFTQYKDYVTSFSSGVISANSPIQVGLAFSKTEWKPNEKLDKDIFDISPSVDG